MQSVSLLHVLPRWRGSLQAAFGGAVCPLCGFAVVLSGLSPAHIYTRILYDIAVTIVMCAYIPYTHHDLIMGWSPVTGPPATCFLELQALLFPRPLCGRLIGSGSPRLSVGWLARCCQAIAPIWVTCSGNFAAGQRCLPLRVVL